MEEYWKHKFVNYFTIFLMQGLGYQGLRLDWYFTNKENIFSFFFNCCYVGGYINDFVNPMFSLMCFNNSVKTSTESFLNCLF